ncbi:MAG TPA: glycosyltransferase family 4 protein [Burkholderiaceae bacterium]|nr:glycosyltransferase family 4 protein [Burkholderiaceae bacterium]
MPDATAALVAPVLAFAGIVSALALALRRGRAALPLDRPNERSLHRVPVPRIGGMAMMAVLLPIALALLPGPQPWLGPVALLAVVSAIDDFRGLPVAVRLGTQALAAAWLLLALPPAPGLTGPMLPAAFVVAWLATIWMSNLYNFMDGSDGLAGGMTLFGFAFLGIAALWGGNTAVAAAGGSVAAAAAAFLIFNFAPARVFMGDAGSVPLGFLAAALSLQGALDGLWHPLFALLVFSPFIVDATVTLARRALRRERVWQAHREHYYQRVIRMGASHRTTALAEYALMAAAGASALWAHASGRHALAAAAWAAIYVAIAAAIDLRWRRGGSVPRGDARR